MRTRAAIRLWFPLVLWMGAIFYLSAQPSDSLPDVGAWDLLLKKGAHFTAYAILAWLAYRVCEGRKRPFLLAFFIAVLYAVSDEYHQTFVPGRNGNGWDVLIDSAGAFVGLIILARLKLKSKQKKPAMTMSDRP